MAITIITKEIEEKIAKQLFLQGVIDVEYEAWRRNIDEDEFFRQELNWDEVFEKEKIK
jgi:hypothetical protein